MLRGQFGEQFTSRPDCTFGLPERRAAIVAKRIECADVGERDDFIAAKACTRNELVERAVARRTLHARFPIVGAVVTKVGFRLWAFGFRKSRWFDHRRIVTPAL